MNNKLSQKDGFVVGFAMRDVHGVCMWVTVGPG
jgi:hypothetical protein